LIPLITLKPEHKALFVTCSLPDLNSKLADFGMIPGSVWRLIRKIPFSGPLVLSNGNTRISVRMEDASSIFMDPA
jgi:Fe2+ transport system protein FeoA